MNKSIYNRKNFHQNFVWPCLVSPAVKWMRQMYSIDLTVNSHSLILKRHYTTVMLIHIATQINWIILLSILTATFPGGSGTRISPFWILLELRMMEMVWQLELYDVQSSSQIITINKPTPSFLQARCHSGHPTNSVRELKQKVSHSMDLITQAHLQVFQHCFWPLKAPG